MKKLQKWLILFVGILLITGCRDNASSNKKVNNGKSVNDVLEKQTKAEEQKEQTEEKDKKKESTDTSENTETEDVDYDLTEMNSDMVYATVYQMMMEPEQYEGKTIRIDGNYYISKDEATGNTYHFCVIKDALACCAQGLEFVRKMRKNCRMKIIRNRKQKLSFRERSRHIKNQMMRLCIAGSQMRICR